MADPGEPSVGVYVPSFNTVAVTELCVRTMRQFAGRPFVLTVGDAGSTDGSVDMLRGLASEDLLVCEAVSSRRQHAEWLDHWFASCPFRYAVFSDSDVEYRGEGWLADLVAAAQDRDAALVATRIQARDFPAYRHPVTGATARLAPRPEPWLLLIDVAQTRHKVSAGFGYCEEETAQGLTAYDVAAAFFRDLDAAGLRWVEMPESYQRSYRHFGGMSWQKPRDSQLRIERRARQLVKAAQIRAALARARRRQT